MLKLTLVPRLLAPVRVTRAELVSSPPSHSRVPSVLPSLSLLPSCLVLPLVPPGGEGEVDARRSREPEGLRYRNEVQSVDVENVAHGVTRVRHEVAPVRVPGPLVQVVVLLDEPLELAGDVRDLLRGELVLVEADLRSAQIPEEPGFLGGEEQKRPALPGRSTGGTSDTVDVLPRVIGRVELDGPIEARASEASVWVSVGFGLQLLLKFSYFHSVLPG